MRKLIFFFLISEQLRGYANSDKSIVKSQPILIKKVILIVNKLIVLII